MPEFPPHLEPQHVYPTTIGEGQDVPDGAADFLIAQVSRGRDRTGYQPVNWDQDIVESSSALNRTLHLALNAVGNGVNDEIAGVCARLIEVFSDFTKYEMFLAHRDGAAQDLLDLLQKAFSREAVVWGQLLHPNILPFYGIHYLDDAHSRMGLVSPWIFNGHIHSFLQKEPQSDRLRLIVGVAAGMLYLHENGVVHGDLKCLNILVTTSGEACLTDFGFSYVTDSPGLEGSALSSAQIVDGTPGFEAPELIDPDNPISKKTTSCDVWAFGMIFTGRPPYGNSKTGVIAVKVSRGDKPLRPKGRVYLGRGMTDDVWTLMEECWFFEPERRPDAVQIKQRLPSVDHQPADWTHPQRPQFDLSGEQADVDITVTTALRHLQSL
ncbi:hypothetical protein DXG01_001989 [Tephrocybe rancida]|nr:hypothetical protein DXG01_001989 [Tephrocybe rancida]